MEYTNTLLPAYKSWFAFYSEVKKHFRNDSEDLYWDEYKQGNIIMNTQTVMTRYKYSVRFIEQQTLAELIELRRIQTFNMDQLRILQYAMTQMMHFESSPELEDVKNRINDLLTDERKKLRR
ncbi:hypothetical protein GO755_39050 [Spirosoma sp. HMF4905]|uniref:Uncharacterized protein n=1 Tax=Spirosoma arboris TaxID=2682092 RepID=A0A7K1SQL6_9BACT|nr:hypothetical protein [Spirosoma arboris]MVM36077.1 hypothetical protein [Spirosoma arboris]